MFQDQIARFEWRNVCWDLIQSSKFLDRYAVSVLWFFLAKEMIGRAESLFVNASINEMIFCRCFVKMSNVWIRSCVESVVKTEFFGDIIYRIRSLLLGSVRHSYARVRFLGWFLIGSVSERAICSFEFVWNYLMLGSISVLE